MLMTELSVNYTQWKLDHQFHLEPVGHVLKVGKVKGFPNIFLIQPVVSNTFQDVHKVKSNKEFSCIIRKVWYTSL